MEDLRIHFVLWLDGEAPPNLAGIKDPVPIPVSFRTDRVTTLRNVDATRKRLEIAANGEVDV